MHITHSLKYSEFVSNAKYFFQNNSVVYNATDICHNVKCAHFLESELQQLSFTSMHNKSRAVTAGSFPFQKIKMEKKVYKKKRNKKKLVFFFQQKHFK